jgi:hypothetical protein
MRTSKMANRIVEKWMAQRVAYRYMAARTYKEYVKEKKRKGEKPLSKKEWEGGNKDDDKGKGKGLGGRLKGLLKSIPNVSKKVAEAVKSAPKQTQQFIVDKEFRGKVTKAAAKAVAKGSKKAAKAVMAAGKKELKAMFVDTPKILASCAKEKRLPTKSEAKTLYGVGVYAVGTALGTIGTGGLGGALYGGGKALLHSLSLHMAIGAASEAADEVFLAGEAGESAITAAGFADILRGGSGNLPGVGHVMDAVRTLVGSEESRHLVLAAEDEAKMGKLVDAMIGNTVKQLEKGFSDDDMAAILQAA